ncbi:MAG: hypothetical protein NT122_03315 [Solirubrobacterales bacterium]|nr:hypothetical protein [Solirubrobacterales bacterium]
MSSEQQLATAAGRSAHPRLHLLADIAGWYGMTAIVTAYLLVSIGTVASDSWSYQLLNLTGAIGLMAVSWTKGVMQGVILNIFWVTIAIIGLSQL